MQTKLENARRIAHPPVSAAYYRIVVKNPKYRSSLCLEVPPPSEFSKTNPSDRRLLYTFEPRKLRGY